MNPSHRLRTSIYAGFTLVELMVSVSIIGLIMLVLVSMVNQISETWRTSTGKITEFQEARSGFRIDDPETQPSHTQYVLGPHWHPPPLTLSAIRN